MNLLSPATLGLAAAFLLLNAVGTPKLHGQPGPDFTAPIAPASQPLPSNIPPASPLAQVVHLVQAGIDENIVQSYISNSTSTFNLDSDRIIYLSDLGVPTSLMTLMMQKDQALQQQIASSQTPPPAPATPPTPDSTPDPTAAYASEPPPDNADASTQSVPPDVTVNYFYDTLTPYGSWVDVDGYGQCWRPTVVVYNHDWQPYGDCGHWINSDCGWYWQSGYAWNSTFHYGRWFRDANHGWCWWPDTVWAPSWVTWRYTDDYCGWAPLPPFTVYRPGVGFLFRGSGISVSFDFGLAADSFIFVPTDHFYDAHPRRFRCPPARLGEIYGRSTVINDLGSRAENGHYLVSNGGVPSQHFTQNGDGPVHTVPIHDLPNPYSGHNPSPMRRADYQPAPGNSSAPNRNFGNNNAGSTAPHSQLPERNLSVNNNFGTPAHNASQPNHPTSGGQYPGNGGVRTPVASGNYQPNTVNNGYQGQVHSAYPTTRPVQPSSAPIARNTPVYNYQQNTPAPISRPAPVETGNRFPEPAPYVAPHESPAPAAAPQRSAPAPAPQPAQSSGGNHSNGNGH
jgi:hypothetical protein